MNSLARRGFLGVALFGFGNAVLTPFAGLARLFGFRKKALVTTTVLDMLEGTACAGQWTVIIHSWEEGGKTLSRVEETFGTSKYSGLYRGDELIEGVATPTVMIGMTIKETMNKGRYKFKDGSVSPGNTQEGGSMYEQISS